MNTDRFTGHTPGPWRAEAIDDENAWVMADDSSGTLYLAEVIPSDSEGYFERNPDIRWANIELMAAAPDLLALVQTQAAQIQRLRAVEKAAWDLVGVQEQYAQFPEVADKVCVKALFTLRAALEPQTETEKG